MFAELDQMSVNEFGRILEKTENRSNVVGYITSDLQSELEQLTGFLETLATRRPIGRSSVDHIFISFEF